MEDIFRGKNVLVTGGAGSIGSEIVKQVLKYGPKTVRSFDNNETEQFYLQQNLPAEGLRILIGDVRDKDRLSRAMKGIDIVFHAAALKHVPMCEYNPFEAIKTNVIGTQNAIEAAIDNGVEKFITISTDKATNPINTMGATKLLAERLTIDANNYKGTSRIALSCVRFGNVLNSKGSVTEVFEKQIASGGPLTVTDHDMTRFVMSIEQAVGLILKAVKKAHGGEIFILKMPVIRLKDLQDVMIEELAPKYGLRPSDISVKKIGVRAGEKFYEELMTEEESARAYESEEMLTVLPQIRTAGYDLSDLAPTKLKRYTSHEAKLIGRKEIKKLVFGE